MCRSATMHHVTDRQTDSMMPMADHTACNTIRQLKETTKTQNNRANLQTPHSTITYRQLLYGIFTKGHLRVFIHMLQE